MFRGLGFLTVVRFGSRPLLPLPSVILAGDTQEDWEKETTCWWRGGGRGEGRRWGRSHIIRLWKSLVLCKLFDKYGNLWCFLSKLRNFYFKNRTAKLVRLVFYIILRTYLLRLIKSESQRSAETAFWRPHLTEPNMEDLESLPWSRARAAPVCAPPRPRCGSAPGWTAWTVSHL